MDIGFLWRRLQITIDVQRLCQDRDIQHRIINCNDPSARVIRSRQIAFESINERDYHRLELEILDQSTDMLVSDQIRIMGELGFITASRENLRRLSPAAWVSLLGCNA